MSSAGPPPPAVDESLIPDHLIPKEEWYEVVLRYALYAGAVFQLACILAVLVLPAKRKRRKGEGGDDDEEVGLG